MRRYSLALVSFALMTGCSSDDPTPNPETDVASDVAPTDIASTDTAVDSSEQAKVQVDFLWVIDSTTSMCQEQAGLERGFKAFAQRIEGATGIDARVAVTSSDTKCDNDGVSTVASKGKFNQKTTRTLPPSCRETRRVECASDTECADLDCNLFESCEGPQDKWRCNIASNEVCTVNPNGSLNSTCMRSCETDQDCETLFGDASYTCIKPNGQDGSCMHQPDVATCPEELPAFLSQDTLGLFPCTANLGVTQKACGNVTSSLEAGFMALDSAGVNADQASAFLRPEAYLVVVFVTDGDDCSLADGETLSESDSGKCALLNTSDKGGPLAPVSGYVSKFKALKTNPAKVMVATISGDSLASTAEAMTSDREAYAASKTDPTVCHQQTSICDREGAVADFGARLLAFTTAFEGNGTFLNICAESGLTAAMQTIADRVIEVAK